MRKILIYTLVLLFATGCIEIVPQEVHQDIKISNNGDVSVTYEGTFMDLYDVLVAMENEKKGSEKLPSISEYQKSTIKMLKQSKFNKKAYNIAPHKYYAKWQEDANIHHPTSYLDNKPYLLHYDSDLKIPKPITLNSMQNLSDSAFSFTYDEMKDFKESDVKKDSNDWMTPLIKKYASGYKAKVSIEIDSDLVLKSNATTMTKLSNGMSLYEWPDIKFEDKDSKVDFVFSFDSMDRERYKLASAPTGTSCKSLIGTDCKCGPFSLYSYDGSPLSYRGYIIKSNNITKKGCSDEKGNVPSITSKVTGMCTITMLTEKESSKLCGNKKLKH
ncbi:MAG: hypothetical protein PHI79_03620 [Sulfurovaceae bacterium]|nr:hypothetical protein [Sulfurovaceae bacterium]